MILYNETKQVFLSDTENLRIAPKIENLVLKKLGHHTGKSEFRSWINSMEHMYKIVGLKAIPPDTGIAVEYNIPQTSKRIDFIISGYNAENKPCIIIVELKQWNSIKAIEGSDSLVETYTGGAVRTVVHPSYQAWSYGAFIKDYNKYVQENDVKIYPCVYLHNYKLQDDDPLISEQYQFYTKDIPVFTKDKENEFREFIMQNIKTGDNCELIKKIDESPIHPSKCLQNSIESMIKGNREFIMIDEQQIAFDSIMNISNEALQSNKKHTVIVEGGAGTGKTVIAINLLSQLTLAEQSVHYVSKNRTPRTVYMAKLKNILTKSNIDNLFKGSGIYTQSAGNTIGIILADEAHRLTARSGIFNDTGENQVGEIIHTAKCSIFFIDERQRVTISDIGSIKEIEYWAEKENSTLTKIKLNSQFRCGNGNGYMEWLDYILQINNKKPDISNIEYDIKIIDTPSELYNFIIQKNNGKNCSRLLAGYCWNTKKSKFNKQNSCDIKIGDFEINWNRRNSIFAIDDTAINEAGCIHVVQGLEFDYVGVIIGEDLRYEDGKVITDFTKRASTDQSLKGIKKLYKENPKKALDIADEIIKNTYRTLMSRGMKGCYIYCVDKELSEYLSNSIKPISL